MFKFDNRSAIRGVLAATALLASMCPGAASAREPVAAGQPALLAALEGKWTMRGDVRGKPVTYAMEARPVLQDKFVELHMRDAGVPSEYEARVFIGLDPATGTVIAHWMDNHGAQASIPHATGHIAGDTLQFTFPYKSGQFRDTFTYDRAAASWVFLLEAQGKDGGWKHFARYQVEKAAP